MDSERWFNLGIKEVKLNNFEAAKGMFENALKINKGYIEAHEELAMTNLHLGDFNRVFFRFLWFYLWNLDG